MKYLIVLALVIGLTGCSGIVTSQLPSVKYCSKVKYDRQDKIVHIEADCEI